MVSLRAQAARLQYRFAFWESCWMACVYFSYAAANWFCSKNALASTLRRASTLAELDMGGSQGKPAAIGLRLSSVKVLGPS